MIKAFRQIQRVVKNLKQSEMTSSEGAGETQTAVSKVAPVRKSRDKHFSQALLFLRESVVKLTDKIRDEAKNEILYGRMNLKVYVDKVKKDLNNKNELNNWLTT